MRNSSELLFIVCHSRVQLETDLKIEKEWRQTLQEDLQKEKDSLSHLRSETQRIISLKKVNGGKTFKIIFWWKFCKKENHNLHLYQGNRIYWSSLKIPVRRLNEWKIVDRAAMKELWTVLFFIKRWRISIPN